MARAPEGHAFMKVPFEVEGIINEQSTYDVSETMDRIESIVWARGMKVFARINQQHEAKLCCLDMHPSQILIFGDARTATPLINAFPSVALELPLKILVWETDGGEVWVSYSSVDYVCGRHGLGERSFPDVDAIVRKALHHPQVC
jgi:uncharacterized protein (DUF302 family)